MEKDLIGLDIGGTKCAVVYGVQEGDNIVIVDKVKFPTADMDAAIGFFFEGIGIIMSRNAVRSASIGISCGERSFG